MKISYLIGENAVRGRKQESLEKSIEDILHHFLAGLVTYKKKKKNVSLKKLSVKRRKE